MGFNTTVLILNDYTHDIAKAQDLGVKLAIMLSSGTVGEVIPGVKIIETHHADDDILVRIGGNRGVVEYRAVELRKSKRRREG